MSVAIIIPTFDNPQYLYPCVESLLKTCDAHIYVVNNGMGQYVRELKSERVTILQQNENLGWEGGLKVGLENTTEDLILFLNDDTFIPPSSQGWLERLVSHFDDPQVSAVGPSSNCVMGIQSIFVNGTPNVIPVNFLIGFCMMVRRSAIEECGGVDDTLPGGDDLDLSIRLRKAGYRLVCDKNAFVYHHGFKTGERVNGTADVKGGWNSIEMMERTNFALIVKHGLREWLFCMNQLAVK